MDNTMNINDVQNTKRYERRNIRINIRITPSQNKFIIDNNLSITKVMNEALKQLGYINQKTQDISDEDKENGGVPGNIYWKNKRARSRGSGLMYKRTIHYRSKRRRS